jgi:tryptophan synthase alpha subunit
MESNCFQLPPTAFDCFQFKFFKMNRLQQKLNDKKENLLTIYFTAGYPELNDTGTIIKELEAAGADIIEVGMPFSDPVADGPTIQASSLKALQNGMSIKKLLEQLKAIKNEVNIPILLMGYINPIWKYGVEKFLADCEESGVSGLILPDIPLDEYLNRLQTVVRKAQAKQRVFGHAANQRRTHPCLRRSLQRLYLHGVIGIDNRSQQNC